MIRLYPPVKVVGQSFVGTKVLTVPNQSLTLKDVIRKFVRREALPIMHEGTYSEGDHGDLEKFATLDFTEQEEIVEAQKKKVSRFKEQLEKRQKEKLEKHEKENQGKSDTPPGEKDTGSGSSKEAPAGAGAASG